MADITIQKQGEVFISQSEYDALRLAGNLQSNTKYHITKTPKTGVDSLEQMNLLNGDKTVTYNTADGMTINGQARFTYDGGTTKDVTMDIDLPIVDGEGITIDKVNGQEKVEVKLDTAFTDGKYAAKITQPYTVYVTDSLGYLNTNYHYASQPITDAFVMFDSVGCLRTNGPVAEADDHDRQCVNIGYADARYVKSVAGITNAPVVYIRGQDGTDKTASLDSLTASAYSIAQRDVNGNIKVGTPVGINDATNKAYVDGLHHYTHHIEIRDATSEIFITLAIKNYPNPATDLNDVAELVSVLTGQMQPIMATGVVDGHNVHAVFVQADQKLYAKFYDSTKGILTDKVDVLLPGTVDVHDIVE